MIDINKLDSLVWLNRQLLSLNKDEREKILIFYNEYLENAQNVSLTEDLNDILKEYDLIKSQSNIKIIRANQIFNLQNTILSPRPSIIKYFIVNFILSLTFILISILSLVIIVMTLGLIIPIQKKICSLYRNTIYNFKKYKIMYSNKEYKTIDILLLKVKNRKDSILNFRFFNEEVIL